MQLTIYSILLIVSFIVSAITAHSSRHNTLTGERKFLFPLMICITIWSFIYSLSYTFTDPRIQEKFLKLVNFGATGAPVFYMLFVLQYSQKLPKLKPWHYILLFIIPCCTVVCALTNDYHHLSWVLTGTTTSLFAGTTVVFHFGIIPWIFIVYSYILLIFSLIMLIRSSYNFPVSNLSHVRIITISVTIPLIGNLLYLFFPHLIRGIDLTPITFSIAGIMLLTGIKRYGLLRIKPLGRNFLFESMNDGVLFLDVNNQIIDYNQSASRILKIHFNRNKISDSRQIGTYHPGLDELCVSGAPEYTYLTMSENPPAYYHAQIHKLKDNWSNIIGKIILLHEVTDIIKSRKIIDQQNADLSLLNEQKDKIISIISHDLRSPFASIINLAELMWKEYDNFSEADRRKFISQIIARTKNTYELLENLLQWSKSITNSIVFNTVPIDLAEQISETAKMYETQASDKHIGLRINPDKKTQPKILANEQLFSTVLRNLITNAIKFTPENGEIVITYEYLKEHCLISVSDNGVGIPKAQLKNLFCLNDNFYTIGTKGEAGSGLGLRLCSEFVEKMGGVIQVSSKVNKGTCISFTLPYKIADIIQS
jgi:signal transduction histidine kinase